MFKLRSSARSSALLAVAIFGGLLPAGQASANCRWFKVCGFPPNTLVNADVLSGDPSCLSVNNVFSLVDANGCLRFQMCTVPLLCANCPPQVYVAITVDGFAPKAVTFRCGLCGVFPFFTPYPTVDGCVANICTAGGDTSGTAIDITGCAQPDCNGNGIPDKFDPDGDGDSVPDDCDVCPGFDDSIDSDGDGVPDGCDTCPGAGDCCFPNGTPGCDDATCCDAICAIDPTCCNDAWDISCASEAAADPVNCPQCSPPNNLCLNKRPIFDGATPFSTIAATTDGPSPSPCGLLGSDIWYVYNVVHDGQLEISLCRDTNYDATLAVYDHNDCTAITDGGSPPTSGDCCVDHFPGKGCEDFACEIAVCVGDSFCCDKGWDHLCAQLAAITPPCICDDGVLPKPPIACDNDFCAPGGAPQVTIPVAIGDVITLQIGGFQNSPLPAPADQGKGTIQITKVFPGACCIWDGSCADGVTAADCAINLGGVFQGGGTTCLGVVCPPAPVGVNFFLDPVAFDAALLLTPKLQKSFWDFKPNRLPLGSARALNDPLNIDTHSLDVDDPWTNFGPPPPPSGTCCTDNGPAAPGCSDPVCEAAVCAVLPNCCTVTWGELCAAVAAASPACSCVSIIDLWPPEVDNVTFQSNIGPQPQPPLPNPRGQDGLFFANGLFGYDNNILIATTFADSYDIISGPPAGDNHTAIAIEIVDAEGLTGGGPVLVTVYDKLEVPVGKIKVTIATNPPPPPVNNPLCVGAIGDCCIANGSIGCDDKVCCSAICNADPFCCDTEWDSLCADDAGFDGTNCPQCLGLPSPDVPKKAFLGIISKDQNVTIGRINLFSLDNGKEGISSIAVYQTPSADIAGPLGPGFPDGCVDAIDLAVLLNAWCSDAGDDPDPPGDIDPPCEGCTSPNFALADLSGAAMVPDGCVDAFDLAKLLSEWCSVAGGNPCGTCGP